MMPIYGWGVTNDTIVPGYGVTKAPVNLHTFWSLPNGTTRNFGGESQYVTYPLGRSPLEYMLARNFMDPNHISQWNPMLIGIDLTGNGVTNPLLSQAGLEQAYNLGRMLREQDQINSAVQTLAQVLSSMETSLSELIKSDKLSAAQKAELQKMLDKVIAKKEEIAKKLQQNPSTKDIENIQKEVLDLQKEVSKTAENISTQLKKGAEDSSKSGSKDSDLKGTDYEDIDPKTGKSADLTNPSHSDVEELCSKIAKAILPLGTNEESLTDAVKSLDKNNIVEVVKNWEKGYGKHTANGNNGFFARIFDDIDDDLQSELIPVMLKALTERAEALGIYDEIKSHVSSINKGLIRTNFLGMVWHDDHQLANDLMAIYNKIAAKENANIKGAQKAKQSQKSDKSKDAAKRKTEVVAEKKAEFARDMKVALKLDETPELTSKLEVKTDKDGEFAGYKIVIEGCTYEAQSYSELVKQLEKYNLKAEDCLMNKKLDKAA